LSDVHLKFQRWLGVGWVPKHHAYVRVSNDNGVTWTTVWENSIEIADEGWVPVELNISDAADNREQVVLRWTMGPIFQGVNEPVTYCGWNIDDIQLLAILLTDCNENGIQDVRDIADCDPNDPACQDCNENKVPDGCDIADETSQDANKNGIPDECE